MYGYLFSEMFFSLCVFHKSIYDALPYPPYKLNSWVEKHLKCCVNVREIIIICNGLGEVVTDPQSCLSTQQSE